MMHEGKTFRSFNHLMDEVSVFSLTTTQHENSAALLTFHLAMEAGFDTSSSLAFYDAAKVHDVGKIFIPRDIIEKPGRLTDDEHDVVKRHTVEGCKVLNYFTPDDELAYQMSLYHHERVDGSGYPYGLTGKDIPVGARLLAIADVYDALRSKRSYKPPMSHDDAMRIMDAHKHTYDWDYFNAFQKLGEELLTRIVKSKYEKLDLALI